MFTATQLVRRSVEAGGSGGRLSYHVQLNEVNNNNNNIIIIIIIYCNWADVRWQWLYACTQTLIRELI